jgi:CHAT domain-containing protein
LSQSIHAPDIVYQMGRLLKQQGDRTGAIAAYSDALNTLRLLRNDLLATSPDVQFSFRESVEPVYRQLVSLLLQPGEAEVSQQNLQQAREVIESLQLAQLENFFQEACLNARATQIDRVDAEAAVLYSIILDDRLEVVLSLANQPLQHFSTPIPQNEMETVLEKMRRSLRRTSAPEERLEIAQRVYNLLLKPSETAIAASKVKTLVFVLDGTLQNVPLSALHDGQQYLIEKYSLALAPGLQLLEPQPLEREKLKVLMGGLTEASQGFSALPGVESEIQQITAELPTEVLLNQTFTSETLQNQIGETAFPVIHLATHGQFSSSAKDTFILAWDSPINVKQLDELLRSRDRRERRPIKLLVLSACQTAEGDRRAALGLAGVAVRSGARSTLATLWSVDDESTAQLMVQFYQGLAQTKLTKAEALRQAQLALQQQPDFQHPYYWAPFVLVGNWL